MNPLIINTDDHGGAAMACLRLHEGLLRQSQSSRLLLKKRTRENLRHTYVATPHELAFNFETCVAKFMAIRKALGFHRRYPTVFTRHRPRYMETYSYPSSQYDVTKSDIYKQADLINLHWVANFVNYKTFFKRNDRPVVWTLHDQNPFLGLEHYAETFVGIDEQGYPIKRTITNDERALFSKYLQIKKQAIQGCRPIQLVAPSLWMKSQAENSHLFADYPITVIPNGLDSEFYKPLDRSLSRDFLNVPRDAVVLLFVANYPLNIRKGYAFLQRALLRVESRDVIMLCLGRRQGGVYRGKHVIDIGNIVDERLMPLAYSAADVFVMPSLMDNLPNTVMESLMCGTPVIGFPVGGVPDMVQDGENGYLVPKISVSALGETIDRFIDAPSVFDRSHVRANAVGKYDLSIQAKAYIRLYESILL